MQFKYTFERTELRTIQNMCGDDTELFLTTVASMIGHRDEQIKDLKDRIAYLTWSHSSEIQ